MGFPCFFCFFSFLLPQRQPHALKPSLDEDDEPTLLMVQVCALNDVEAEDAPHARVVLDETRAQVHLGEEGGDGVGAAGVRDGELLQVQAGQRALTSVAAIAACACSSERVSR